jgi:hypothetical protein
MFKVTQNLLEIYFEGNLIAKIDEWGNYTCDNKDNLVKALRLDIIRLSSIFERIQNIEKLN